MVKTSGFQRLGVGDPLNTIILNRRPIYYYNSTKAQVLATQREPKVGRDPPVENHWFKRRPQTCL